MSEDLAERFDQAPSSEGGYLLAAVAVAVACGSRQLNLAVGSNEANLDFSYVPTQTDLSKSLVLKDLKDLPEIDNRIVLALQSGLLAGAPRVDFESWDGAKGQRVKLTPDSIKTESLSKAPWKDGRSGCRIAVKFRTGLGRRLFGGGTGEVPSGVKELVESRARYCGLPVLFNEKKVNREVELGEGLLAATFRPAGDKKIRPPKIRCKADLEKEIEASSHYYGKFLYGGEEVESRIVSRGLDFEIEIPLADDLGFSGIIVCEDLNLDRDHESLLEDTKLDDLLNDVENDLLTIAGGLVDVIDDLEDDAVEAVLETLDMVVEAHRSSGENDVALELLKRLVEVENIPDEVRASHLTQMARTFERDEQDEVSFEYYGRALEYWGLIPPDEQDLELVATALLGASRLMSYYDSEPETAMKYASNALELRRSVGEEDDLEMGEAAELLAGLYLKHRTYPQPEYLEVEELLKVALNSFQSNYGQNHDKVAGTLTELGKFCQERGSLDDAESHFIKALAIKEKLFGSKDLSVGELFDRLARLFEANGEILKSGKYYARALEVREHLLDEGDPEIEQRLNDLVILYRVYGHFQKAEPLFLRVLKIEDIAQPPDTATASELCSLALFYQAQDMFKKAEVLYSEALNRVNEEHPDENHPDKAWIHGLFGRFYDEQYLFKKAEDHLLKSLEMTESILGEDHPDLVVYLEALSRHYRLQQRFEEAMPWAERALAVAESFYGTQHPYLATALNSFGELLTNSGQAGVAGPVYLAAYEIQKTTESKIPLTPLIPDEENARLSSVRDEAEKFHEMAAKKARDYTAFAEVESFYLRALFLREQSLGAEHPDNARTLGLLADLYRNHRRYEGAESLYKRSLELRKRNLGEGHPDCCLSLSELTSLLLLQNNFEEAKPLLEEWLEIVERTLGQTHAEYAEVLVRAGLVSEVTGDVEHAKELLQQAVNIRHSVFGTEHPTFAVTLAELLRVEEKPEQAAELYDFVVLALEKNLGVDDPILIPIFENYAKVLSAIDEEEKSAVFETRAMVMRAEHGLDFGSVE